MAGYSGTPLPKKLGIKEGSRVLTRAAYQGFERLLEPLPPAARFLSQHDEPADVIVAFATNEPQLLDHLTQLKPRLDFAGGLWIAWPKRTSGMASSLNETAVREAGLASGLVDNKVCAIDERWSGLRFVYRLADRPKR